MIKAEEGERPISAGMEWGHHDLDKMGCLP